MTMTVKKQNLLSEKSTACSYPFPALTGDVTSVSPLFEGFPCFGFLGTVQLSFFLRKKVFYRKEPQWNAFLLETKMSRRPNAVSAVLHRAKALETQFTIEQ